MPSLRLSCLAVSLQTAVDGNCRPTKKGRKEEEEKEEEEKVIKEGMTKQYSISWIHLVSLEYNYTDCELN